MWAHLSNALLWLSVVSLVIAAGTAARLPDQGQLQLPEQQLSKPDLLTYYFDVMKPNVALDNPVRGRPGRTAVTLTLSQPSISTYMPVVSPKASGMTHQVSKTWVVFKHLSTMFERVKAINAAQPSQPRLFPRGFLAIQAAADNSPAKVDINTAINAAEALGKHDIWAETSPGSLLLLPTRQSTAAVADLMDVTYNSNTGLITLHIDLVHNPDTISEFQPHGKQSLASDEAHYHFSTAPGVKVDAAALLKSLQDTHYQVDGAHVFLKGQSPTRAADCVAITITPGGCPEPATAEANTDLILTIQADASGCSTPNFGGSASAVVYVFGAFDSISTVRVGNQDGAAGAEEHLSLGTEEERRATDSRSISLTLSGSIGTGTLRVSPGPSGRPFAAVVTNINANANSGPVLGPLAVFNCAPPPSPPPPTIGSPVSKLLLAPAKAYRHLHDPIKVTALALDANNAPIVNASVVLAVYGDCDPLVSQLNYTTGADGQATFTIISTKPGVVSAVAAMVDSRGLPVVSNPSHIIYFDEHSYIDEREEQYYGPKDDHQQHSDDSDYKGDDGYKHSDDDYKGSDGVGHRGDDLDDDKGYNSDAESYAAAAKKAALQQIGSKAVTQRN